jgi:hypothetical protein
MQEMKKNNQETSKQEKVGDPLLSSCYFTTKENAKKHPVISKILKQLTPERIEKEIEAIQKVKLPPELQKWVKEYEKVGGERDDFIWKWTYNISRVITLTSVEKKYRRSVSEVKFLMIMFVVLIDDVADKHKNNKVLKELLKIPFNLSGVRLDKLGKEEIKYVKFVIRIWRYIITVCKKYPRFSEFKEIIEFDIKQLLNAMEYSYLVNKNNYLINGTEFNVYLSHNMQLVIDMMIDLCCSSKFNIMELGMFRRISWHAQQMTRIGNWVTTWKREISEKDFSSGIFAYALEHKVISLEDIRKNSKLELVDKIRRSEAESSFLKEWECDYQEIKKLNRRMKTIDVNSLLASLEKVIFAHLISKGYK